MTEYLPDFDYTEYIERLKADMKYYPVELQLVWLLELLLMLVYLQHRSSYTVNDRGKHVFYARNLIDYLGDNKKINMSFMRVFTQFRNKYVHEGPTAASSLYDKLIHKYTDQLKILAKFVGIRLNFGLDLYSTFEEVK